MWRWIVLVLVLANGLLGLWGYGPWRDGGWGPGHVAEPERLKNQLRPEALEVKPQAPVAATAPLPAAPSPAGPASELDTATPSPAAPSTSATPPIQAPTVKGK